MNFELAQRETQAELRNLRRSIEAMSSTVATGLEALQQADSDLAAAVTANTAATQAALTDIKSLVSQLAASQGASEDPQVQAIATDIETKVAAIQASTAALTAAVTPATPAAPAAPAPAAL